MVQLQVRLPLGFLHALMQVRILGRSSPNVEAFMLSYQDATCALVFLSLSPIALQMFCIALDRLHWIPDRRPVVYDMLEYRWYT